MQTGQADEWICRAYCSFFKPNRVEEERCRGYTLACLLNDRGLLNEPPAAIASFDASFRKDFLRSYICDACPFLIDGCDFTSPDPPENCLPCGGLLLLSRLLECGAVDKDRIEWIDTLDRAQNRYLSLSEPCALKSLEEDYLYHIGEDDLYEVNDDAAAMLARCDGSLCVHELNPDPEFLHFCVEEGLLELNESPSSRNLWPGASPVPSLRYLEWLVTFRCNLSCAHCYLGDSQAADFPEDLIRPLLDQFSSMQGLRILVSGGEPILYKHFDTLNEALPDYPVRAVLLSNGMGLHEGLLKRLHFHEVQISLDGMEKGHDLIRGKGSFEQAVKAMKMVRDAGMDLSVATMIHSGNLDEWDEMRQLIQDSGAGEWSVDYPCRKGRWESHPELAVDPAIAAGKMAYGFGGSYHGTSSGWTCGRHLAAILPSGELCKCGLYQDRPYGHVTNGLEEAWKRIDHLPIDQTECSGCEEADSCGGGCRYRAGGGTDRDEVMCRLFGVWKS